jgi:hypothetical protein
MLSIESVWRSSAPGRLPNEANARCVHPLPTIEEGCRDPIPYRNSVVCRWTVGEKEALGSRVSESEKGLADKREHTSINRFIDANKSHPRLGECMKGVPRVAMAASILIFLACSVLNQPINADAQSTKTGGAAVKSGSDGTGGSAGSGVTQACLAELSLLPGSCTTSSSLAVPCLGSTSAGGGDCMLDDCYAWETICAKCLFGPCCPEYTAWKQIYPTCSQDPGCDLWGGPTWMAWRQCGLSNCTTVCNN